MTSKIDVKGASKGAAIGGLGAGLISVAMYFVGQAAGATYETKDPAAMGGLEVLPGFQPMVVCVIATVVSIGLIAALAKFAPNKAWSIYLGVAGLVFVGEAMAPFWAFEDVASIITLELMHIPAALGIVGGIYKFGVQPSRRGPSRRSPSPA